MRAVATPAPARPAAELTLVAGEPAPERLDSPKAEGLLTRYRAITQSLHALSGATTTENLLPLVVKHLCRAGFERAWLITASDDTATLTHLLHNGEQLCSNAGRTWSLDEAGPEGRMMRRREALAVTVGPEDTGPGKGTIVARSYVTAPITFDTRVVAFLGADNPTCERTASDDDREVIGAFARVSGEILQRTLQLEQIERLRADMRELTGQINARADARAEALLDLAPAPETTANVRKAPLGNPGRIHEVLTRRELEIMRLVAGGETNASIARLLVISDGTVKTHVRSILRKLRATSRAAAIGRYYKLTQ